MATTSPTRPPRRRAALVAAALLVLAACSSSKDSANVGFGTDPTTTVPPPPRAPLTGQVLEDRAAAGRAAVTMKIENSSASRPQSGLDKADVVFEAIVEGGQTRFLAVFHSTMADGGPVRSVRPADPVIVAAFGGVVAFSGGIPRFVEALRSVAGVTAVDETGGQGALRRRNDKSAPHNLYGRTTDLLGKAAPGAKPPPAFAKFLPDGQPFAAAGAVPVTGVDLVVGQQRVGYTWDPASGRWPRTLNGTAHTVEGGAQIAPTTIIVQAVANNPVGEVDTTGSPVLEAQVVGSGDATIFTAGMAVPARWSKPSPTAMTTYTDGAGQPIVLPQGRTWVELPQLGAAMAPRFPPPPAG